MSRFLDFVLIMVGIVGIMVVHMGAAPMLDELRNDLNEDPATGNIDQQNINDEGFVAVTKWVPTIAFFGLFLVGAFREYRRQRVTAVQRRRI